MSLATRAGQAPIGEQPGAPSLRTGAKEVPRLLLLAWGSLLLNVLPPYGAASFLPIPHAMNQAIAQGSLLVAIVLALLVNPRIVIRPNLFLVLVSTMAVVALIVSIHSEFIVGSTYRAIRLCGFVLALWLLTPWWGRRELLLLRVHRLCLWAAVGSVVLGLVISPGTAMGDQGRLSGTIWPMPAPQVAHYAAVLLGTTALLWMCRVIGGRHAALAIVVSVAVLLGTHTRTALLGCVVGLAVGSASLFLGHARVRRTSVWTIVTAIVGGTAFAPQILGWLARGQSAQDAAELTGRTKVWSAATEGQRPLVNELFGNGLSNKSFNGLPVDSNWVATYIDLGWFGIVMQVAFLLLLLLTAATHVRGLRRATALFLTVYCITASFTEVGPGDASPYLLDLFVAASLLAPRPDAVRAWASRARRPSAQRPGGGLQHVQ
ncbi:O-antigen ligase family protein [Pedococcus sp. NPDC057267]|uniref:O-antigen ligase family protein n=1 Tax=Pedococcus sp. NPDC057267 TaxID=3346077 RepID=UPI00363BC463